MNRLARLTNAYTATPNVSKEAAAKHGFMAGFLAARKMCAVMGRIAQLENKDAQEEILKVGTEEVESKAYPPLAACPDVIIDTLT